MNRPGETGHSKYTLLGLIGSGGMGSVYRARHEYTGEVGALKLLHEKHAAEERSLARFLREAKTVSLVKSPNIVRVKDAGRLQQTRPFIFMELLEGLSLKALLRHNETLPLPLVVELLGQAAKGLGAAHEVGIVHRDVKPDNLFLVTRGGALPVVKLLDFGICKLDAALSEQALVTREGTPLGTPGYMAPEQFYDSSKVDRRGDVYALAVVFYQCLTGRLPFVAATVREQCEAAHAGRFPSPKSLRPDLPELVDQVIEKALSPRAEQRYTSCVEFIEALKPSVVADPETVAQAWRALALPAELDEAKPAASQAATPAPSDLSRSADTATIVPYTSWYDGLGDTAGAASGRRRSTLGAVAAAAAAFSLLLGWTSLRSESSAPPAVSHLSQERPPATGELGANRSAASLNRIEPSPQASTKLGSAPARPAAPSLEPAPGSPRPEPAEPPDPAAARSKQAGTALSAGRGGERKQAPSGAPPDAGAAEVSQQQVKAAPRFVRGRFGTQYLQQFQ